MNEVDEKRVQDVTRAILQPQEMKIILSDDQLGAAIKDYIAKHSLAGSWTGGSYSISDGKKAIDFPCTVTITLKEAIK